MHCDRSLETGTHWRSEDIASVQAHTVKRRGGRWWCGRLQRSALCSLCANGQTHFSQHRVHLKCCVGRLVTRSCPPPLPSLTSCHNMHSHRPLRCRPLPPPLPATAPHHTLHAPIAPVAATVQATSPNSGITPPTPPRTRCAVPPAPVPPPRSRPPPAAVRLVRCWRC